MKTEKSTSPAKLYLSLFIPTQTHDTDPARTPIHLHKPPLLPHHHHHHFCKNITLTTQSDPCLHNFIKCLLNLIKG